jgi:tetratricopeptide (TPR) repeat protein
LETALKLKPDYFDARTNLGSALLEQGLVEKAVGHFRTALALDLESPMAHTNLGNALCIRGMHEEGISHFEAALMLDPECSDAHFKLGMALLQRGAIEKAADHFQAAADSDPKSALPRFLLGKCRFAGGLFNEAVEDFRSSLEIDPAFIDARLGLGSALAAQGDFEAAVAELRNAHRLDPDNPLALNDLAWLLAVCPPNNIRNGAEAVRLAKRACEVTGHRDPLLLNTLAAAYAEIGEFTEAVAVASKALDLLGPHQQTQAQRLRRGLQRYQKGEPYREIARAPGEISD